VNRPDPETKDLITINSLINPVDKAIKELELASNDLQTNTYDKVENIYSQNIRMKTS
jgi:hypothetical protein